MFEENVPKCGDSTSVVFMFFGQKRRRKKEMPSFISQKMESSPHSSFLTPSI
jgi:hypothetical protein